MKIMQSSRGRTVAVSAVGLAGIAAAGLVVQQYSTRPVVQMPAPAPGAVVADPDVEIIAPLANAHAISDLSATIDGAPADLMLDADGRARISATGLAEGEHRVEISYGSSNLFARDATRAWTFAVDTSAPALAVAEPAAGSLENARVVRYRGEGEPGSLVRVSWDDKVVETTVKENGRWLLAPELPEGRNATTVTSYDAAGNARAAERAVIVDTAPPDLEITDGPELELTGDSDNLVIRGRVTTEPAADVEYAALVGGRTVAEASGRRADTLADDGLVLSFADYDPGAESNLAVGGDDFVLDVGSVPQGNSVVTVTATDAAGNVSSEQITVSVDTSEQFGESEMVRGARGADVTKLQGRLKGLKLYTGKPTGRYDMKTVAAVKKYQRQRGIPVSGRVDRTMLDKMVGRIVVDIDGRKLRLIRDGRVEKVYPVAVGTATHPTPRGTYEVIDKQYDPAWYPPDSPWAAGLGPIPPGPGNPLGTRWIGTSAEAIGIHGTYADNSIGTAASHGCVRMHISDVEELFEEVALGSTVEFR